MQSFSELAKQVYTFTDRKLSALAMRSEKDKSSNPTDSSEKDKLSNPADSSEEDKVSNPYRRSEPQIRAAHANLRRGVGRKPGELPQLYGEFLEDMPETLYSKGNEPSDAEWAVYMAVTLYALHQQSKDIRENNMNQKDVSLGAAASKLVVNKDDKDEKERIWKRFYVMASSEDMQEMSYHLRGLIQLLRDKDIPLDYPRLAEDLFWFQCSRESADNVRLKWGRDFYKKLNVENEEDNNNEKD